MNTTIETKINNLAAEIIPSARLASFCALPLHQRIYGLQVFAAIGNDSEMLRALATAKDELSRSVSA